MTRRQRAAGQAPPPTRQQRAKGDEGAGAAREPSAQTHTQARSDATWRLEEAKARFSEVVRRAHAQGPQYVTVRGKRAVAIIDATELDRLLPANPAVVPLVEFLESLQIEGLDLTRERDHGRNVPL